MAAQHLQPEAQKACADHRIDFAALVDSATRRLHQALAQKRRPDHLTLVANEDAQRTCRLEVILAAGRAGTADAAFGPLQNALGAVQAAEATGDPTVINAATSHYNQTLASLIHEHDLGAVVHALHQALFTDDIRHATS